ncbi:MAG TPA: lysylphosphatidylglycerol synthase domain-containing protein [Thermoanaerobaculia bacterium]|nr:lysylphosphatidylglycerol synthase domain-containing protein [Thermoanaerobaculia bacterium]
MAGFAAAFALLAYAFRSADLGGIRHLLAGAPALLLTPVFYLVVLACDALGWRRLVLSPEPPPPWRRLLAVRTAAEALGLSLPSGGVLAEATAVMLLHKRCDVPAGPAVASLAARRFYIFLSFGLYLSASAVAGFSLLAAISPRVIGRAGLQWVVPASAAFVLAVALGLRAMLLGGALGERVHRLLHRLPWKRLRAWLDRKVEVFTDADRLVEAALAGGGAAGRADRARTARTAGEPRRAAAAIAATAARLAPFLGIWLAESCETFFIMTLLGAGLSFRQVFSFEGLLTFIRGLAFFLPSGLGIQDLGYLAFLKGLGVNQAVTLTAAFVLVKRSKEVFWIMIGYLLLARQAWRPRRGSGPPP